jgi:predicted GNAT family acetyltransferase
MDAELRKNEAAGRYELLVDGVVVSVADYSVDGDRVIFPHTQTAGRFRGQGLAARLVRFALEDVRSEGRSVVPACWFVADFIAEHEEFEPLLQRMA